MTDGITERVAILEARIEAVKENLTLRLTDLKEANDLYRASIAKAVDQEHKRIEDKFHTHNDVLDQTSKATALDRERYATRDQVEALSEKFLSYKETTGRALAVAEGSKSGIGLVASVVLGAFAVLGTLSGIIGVISASGIFHR